jgi:hypothetical protein
VRRQDLYSSLRAAGALLVGSGGLIAGVQSADARITALTNCTTTSPYGSTSFGSVGTYQQLACTANGTVDPNNPLNAVIQDIHLAPKVGGGCATARCPISDSVSDEVSGLQLPWSCDRGQCCCSHHVAATGRGDHQTEG